MSNTTVTTAISFPLAVAKGRDVGNNILATTTKKMVWDHTNMDKCPIFIQKPQKRRHQVLSHLDESLAEKNGSSDSVTIILDKVNSPLSIPPNNKRKRGEGTKLHHSNIAPSAFANPRIQQAYKRRMDNLERKQNTHMGENVKRLQEFYQQQEHLTIESNSDNLPPLRETTEDIVMLDGEATSLAEANEQRLIKDWVEYEKAPYLKHFKTSDGSLMFKPPPMPNSLKRAQRYPTKNTIRSDSCITTGGGHIDILVLKFFLGGLKNPLKFTLNCMKCKINTYYVASLRGLFTVPVAPTIPVKIYNPWSKIDSKNNWYFNSAMHYGNKFQALTQRALPMVLKMEELYTNQINMGGSKTSDNILSLITMSNRLSYFISFFFLSPFHLLVDAGTVSPYPHFLLELNRRCTFKSVAFDGHQPSGYNPKSTTNAGCQLTYGVVSVRKLSHLFNYWYTGAQTSKSVQHHFSENFEVLENSLGLSSELNLLLKQYRARQTSRNIDIMAGFASRQERYLEITEFLHGFDKMDRSDFTEIVKWLHVPSIFHEHYTFDIYDNHLPPKEENGTLAYECTNHLTCHTCGSRDRSHLSCNWQLIPPSQDKFLLKTVTKFVTLTQDRKTISTPSSSSSTPGIKELKHRSAAQAVKDATFQRQDSIETMCLKLSRAKDEESFMVLQPCYSDRVDTLLNVTRTLMASYYAQFKAACTTAVERENWSGIHDSEEDIFNEGHILCHTQLKGLGEALSLAFLRVAIMFSELITETEYDILMSLAGVGGYQNSFNEYWDNLQREYANLRFQYKGLNNAAGYDKRDLMVAQTYSDYIPVYHLTDLSQGCDNSNLNDSIFIS